VGASVLARPGLIRGRLGLSSYSENIEPAPAVLAGHAHERDARADIAGALAALRSLEAGRQITDVRGAGVADHEVAQAILVPGIDLE
jgi:hypothetical protein